MLEQYIEAAKLAELAKQYRIAAGKSRAEAARDMGTKHPSIFHAEESPSKSYTKLRRRMIEAYSGVKVSGPLFRIEEP